MLSNIPNERSALIDQMKDSILTLETNYNSLVYLIEKISVNITPEKQFLLEILEVEVNLIKLEIEKLRAGSENI